MKLTTTERGFERIEHPIHKAHRVDSRLIQQSSAVGHYPDSLLRPGTSFVWVGDKHHLNREQALELAYRLIAWAETGSLRIAAPAIREAT